MAVFEITMTDRTTEWVVRAEAYAQEGPMTTFFDSDAGRGSLDSWATRLASFRSADVLMIRRTDDAVLLRTVDQSALGPDGRPLLDLVVNDH